MFHVKQEQPSILVAAHRLYAEHTRPADILADLLTEIGCGRVYTQQDLIDWARNVARALDDPPRPGEALPTWIHTRQDGLHITDKE